MSMKRFRVAGHSMTPTLQPGQEIVATDTRRPASGNVVVFEHPARGGFWLVKRLRDDSGWVEGDNPEVGRDDSRGFGPVSLDEMLTVVTHLDAETFVEACDLLAAEDSSLAELVDHWGLPVFWRRPPGFRTLVLLMMEQQVSLESGAAMYRRVANLVGEVTPETIASAGEEALRSIGVTRQKSAYLVDLSLRLLSGDFDLDVLETLPVDQARTALISIRGVGPWTADAYLLSAVRHPDMWPVGDRALQVGTAETLGMGAIPDEAELEIIGEAWRPVRAAAARMIWHGYLSARGRVEPPDPLLAHP